MQHPAGLTHVIRQQGLGDRVWRGENGATKNSKRRENKAEKRRVEREQTLGAQIFSYDPVKVTNFWRIGFTMNQFP